jgi:hypothetical protein
MGFNERPTMNHARTLLRTQGNEHIRRFRHLRQFACMCALISVATMGAAYGAQPLRVEREALEHATPELIQQLRADPYVYFRFVNRSWIARICDDFGAELRSLPVVRLHGDPHVEQFAYTNDAWGLDDFDDSARGPAAIDIVRFLGSIDLAARQRFWEKHREKLFDGFVEGYKRGLAEPDYLPRAPEIVRQLRAQAPRTRAAFLALNDSRIQPLTEGAMKAVIAAVEAFAGIVLRERPDLVSGYFRVVRAGWVQGGVGSAATPKIMVRVQGASDDPADDELLELKKIGDLGGLRCLETPAFQPTLRIIDGSKQLGRLKHSILAAGPELVIPEVAARGQRLDDWWLRNVDPSYRQVRLTDLRSVDDLAAIVHDAGVQLGAGRLQDKTPTLNSFDRKQIFAAAGKLDKRYRQEATKLVDELLLGWKELGAR